MARWKQRCAVHTHLESGEVAAHKRKVVHRVAVEYTDAQLLMVEEYCFRSDRACKHSLAFMAERLRG